MNSSKSSLRRSDGLARQKFSPRGLTEQLEPRLALTVWFVDDSAGGSSSGDSWSNAFVDLQSALQVAEPVDEIWIAAGTYQPTVAYFPPPPDGENTTDPPSPIGGCGGRETFLVPDRVALYGGFAGNETARDQRNSAINLTVVDGGDGASDESAVTVVTVPNGVAATIDGIIIDGGFGYGCGNPWKDRGAGIDVGGELTLSNTTIRNANTFFGGGMYVRGSADLSNVTIRDSGGGYGGAIYVAPGGELSIADSRLERNFGFSGAAIYATEGSLHMQRTAILDHVANSYADGIIGGAVYVESMLIAEIGDSEFSGNQLISRDSQPLSGGALTIGRDTALTVEGTRFLLNSADGHGGAIYNTSTLRLENVSILSNSAKLSGGGIYSTGDLTMVDSTVAANRAGELQNGGGIVVSAGRLNMRDSFVTSNRTGETGRGGGIYLGAGVAASIVNATISSNVAGTTAGFGGGLYIDDTESFDNQPLISSSTIVANTAGTHGGGIYAAAAAAVSMRDSMVASNIAANSGGGLYIENDSVDTESTDIVSLDDFALQANFARYGGGIYNGSNRTTQMQSGRVTDNRAEGVEGRGGGVFNDGGHVTIRNTDLGENYAEVHGAGLFTQGGTINLHGSELRSNAVGGSGGAIYSIATSINAQSSSFTTNQAVTSGGGLHLQGGMLSLTESYVDNNLVLHGNGAGVYNDAGLLLIERTTIESNRTPSTDVVTFSGGGVYNLDGSIELRDSHVQRNHSSGDGGGIASFARNQNVSLTIVNSTVTGNSASRAAAQIEGSPLRGGGIFATSVNPGVTSTVVLDRATVSNNSIYLNRRDETPLVNTLTAGGGLAVVATDPLASVRVTITDSTFDFNQAYARTENVRSDDSAQSFGGGVYFVGQADSTLSIRSSTISRNYAEAARTPVTEARGGGVYAEATANGAVQLIQTTISANDARASGLTLDAEAQGGGVYLAGEVDATIRHSTIVGNLATANGTVQSVAMGGGLHGSAAVAIGHSIIAQNEVIGTTVARDDVSATAASSEGYNLIGIDEANRFIAAGDLRGSASFPLDAKLSELGGNGGYTLTHIPLTGSPAIDGGNLAFDPTEFTPPLAFDQRGQPRVLDGNVDTISRIDIGSTEASSLTFLFGDLNGDGMVGVRDLVMLRRGMEAAKAAYADGDLNGDGRVDNADVAALVNHFGRVLPPIASPSASAAIVRAVPRHVGTTGDVKPLAARTTSDVRATSRVARQRTLTADSVDRVHAVQTNDGVSSDQTIRIRRR